MEGYHETGRNTEQHPEEYRCSKYVCKHPYYDVIHPKVGELADEELDNVSGGCYKGDRLVVTIEHYCTGFICKKCGGNYHDTWIGGVCHGCGCAAACRNCKYCTYEKALWLCNEE